VPSRYEPTRELREPPYKRTFLGDSAPNEREENVLQYVIHCIYEDVPSCTRRGVRPTSLGV
jgi:hypothetical protein